MKQKTWVLTLVAVGLIVAATSAAVSLKSSSWFVKETPVTSSPATSSGRAAAPAPVPAIPIDATPNDQAVIQQAR